MKESQIFVLKCANLYFDHLLKSIDGSTQRIDGTKLKNAYWEGNQYIEIYVDDLIIIFPPFIPNA